MAVGNFSKKIFVLLIALVSFSALWAQECTYEPEADDNPACGSTRIKADRSSGTWGQPNGYWTIISGYAVIANSNDAITDVDSLAFGVTVFEWTSTDDGCKDTLEVTSNTIWASAGPDTVACQGTARLYGSDPTPGTGTWTDDDGSVTYSNDNDPTAYVYNIPYGSYVTFTWTIDYNGCSDAAQMVVHDVTPIIDAGPDDTTCVGDSIRLNATAPPAGCTGYWEVVSGSGTFRNSTAYDTWVVNLGDGLNQFRWVVENDSCSSDDIVNIYNYSVDLTNTTNPGPYCEDNGNLSVLVDPSSGVTGTWKVIASTATITSPNSFNTAVTGLNFGANTFRFISDNNGCKDSIDVTIEAYPIQASATASGAIVCEDSVALYGNDPSTFGGTGYWSASGGATIDNITDPTTFATGLSSVVTNQFIWTVAVGGCTDADTVEVEYAVPDDAIVAQDTGYTCDGTYRLNASPVTYGTGYWTSTTSGVTYSPDNSAATVDVANLQNDVNMFVWHVARGTCPEKTDTIYVINHQFTVDAGGPYDTTCNGCINLAASPVPAGGEGWWTPNSYTFSDDSSANTTACGLAYGENIVTWHVKIDQCEVTDDVTLYNYGIGNVSAGDDQHVCANSATLTANPVTNGSGLWTMPSGATATIDDPTNNITDVHNLTPGGNVFYWTVTNENCSVTDTVIIYNDSVSVANAGVDQILCTDSAQLSANSPTIGTGQWTVQLGGATIVDPTAPDTWVKNLSRGENQFEWEISNAYCSNSDRVSIYNYSVDAYYNQTLPVITCTDTAGLVANNPAGQNITSPSTTATGHWSVETGTGTFDNSNAYNTTVRNLGLDVNVLVWTVENAYCSDTVRVTVINNSPDQAYAGVDTTICGTDYVLNANDPIRGTGHWNVVGGNSTVTDPTLYNSLVTNLTPYCVDTTPEWWLQVNAVNILEWVVEYNGCTSRDTVRIINANPGAPNAGYDTTVCDNVVSLYALDHGTCSQRHWWTAIPPDGIVFKDPYTGAEDNTDFNARAENIQNTTTSFIWWKQNTVNGVTCTLSDTVQITSLGDVEDINAGSDDAVCDDKYTLKATKPSSVIASSTDSITGHWDVIYGHGVFDDDTAYNTTVRNLGYQTNVLRWTLINHTKGCIMTDDVYITNALPSQALVFSDDTVTCGKEATLTANRPVRGYGTWTVVGGNATISNSTCQDWYCNVYVNNLNEGENTFLWTVTNKYYGKEVQDTLVCQLYDTAFVYYNKVVAPEDDTLYVCADTVQLDGNLQTGMDGQWTVLGGTGLFRSTGTQHSVDSVDVVYNLTRGLNTIDWEISKTYRGTTCSDIQRFFVWDLMPEPDPDAGTDQTICSDSTTLHANAITRANAWYNTAGDTVQWGYSTSYWTAPTGGTLVDPTSENTDVKNIPAGSPIPFVWTAEYHFFDSIGHYYDVCRTYDTVYIYNNEVTAEAGSIPGIVCGVEGVGATTTLNATPVSAPQSGIWSKVYAPGAVIADPTNNTTAVTNMPNGDLVFKWTVSATVNGVTCTGEDTVVVKVRIPTTAVVAQPDSFEVCENQATLQANNPVLGVGTWVDQYGSAGTITDPGSATTTVTNLWPGKSKWIWVIDNDGCKSYDTITVINNTVYADAYDVADPNLVNICVDTFQLSATDPNIFNTTGDVATGQWTANIGTITFDDPTLYNTIVRGLSNSNPNVLKWTITKGGCSESSTFTINNNEFTIDADVTSANNEMFTCEDTIQLAGEQPGSGVGQWRLIKGSGSFVDQTLYNTVVHNLSNTESNMFVWKVWRDGCSAEDTVTVFDNRVTSNAGPDDETCTDSIHLNAGNPAEPGATAFWVTIVGPAVEDATDNKTLVKNLQVGLNQFEWVVQHAGCEARDTVNITNNSTEPAVAEDDKEVCADTARLVVQAPPATDDGYWMLIAGGGNIVDSTSYNALVTSLAPGESKFLWVVDNGKCQSYDTLVITNNMVTAYAGLDDTVCADTALLRALGPTQFFPYQGTGQWSAVANSATFDNPNDSVTIVRGLNPGANTLRWTVTKGSCSAYDDVVITNRAVLASATDIAECNMPVTLTGNDPVSNNGIWRNIGGLGTVVEPTNYQSDYTGLDYGYTNKLRWVVYNESCADSVEITVTNNGFTVYAGSDQTLCSDTTTLNAQLPPGGTGYWDVTSGSATFDDSTDPHTFVSGLSQGSNVLTWYVSKNGCTNSADVTITNNSPSEAIITTVNTETCDSSITLDAQTYSPYHGTSQYWNILGTGTFVTSSTDFTVTVDDLEPGSTKIVWTIENGTCVSRDTITVQNNAVIAYAGTPQDICTNTTSLNAADPASQPPYQGSGVWSTADASIVIDDPTNPTTLVSNLPQGASTFTWTVSLGSCSASSDVVVTNNSVTAVAYDTASCSSDVQLRANDPSTFSGSGKWTLLAGSLTIDDQTLYNTWVSDIPNSSTATLQWWVSNGKCEDSTTITVTNNNFDIVASASSSEVCSDTVELTGTNLSGGSGSWSVSGGSGTFDDQTSYNTVVRGLAQGLNTFVWTVSRNGCTNSASVSVTNNQPSDAIILGPSDTVVCDGTVNLAAQSPSIGNGHWEIISGTGSFTSDSSNATITAVNLSPKNNIFKWIVTNGSCTSEDQITIVNNQTESNAGGDISVCTDSAQLAATDPANSIYGGSGYWEDLSGSGATFDDSTDPRTYIRNLPRGAITLTWNVSKAGCPPVADTVVVTNASVNASARGVIVCADSTNLDADPYNTSLGETGYWSIGDPNTAVLVDDSSVYNAKVINLSPGSNEFVWHVSNASCADSVKVYVQNNSFTVNADAFGNVRNICSDTMTLSADNPAPGTGSWTVLSGPGTVDDPTAYNSLVRNLTSTATVLEWTVTKNGCTASDQVSVINNHIDATASPSLTTCDGTVTLDANNPSPGTGLWKKIVPSAPGTIVDPTSNNSQVTGIPNETTIGLRWVVTSAVGSCQDSVEVYVTNNMFDLSAGPDQVVCSDTAVLQGDDPAPGTGEWSVIGGGGTFDNSNLNTTTVRGLNRGDNILQWSVTKNGCTATAQVTITNNSFDVDAGLDQNLCYDTTTITGTDPATIEAGATGTWTLISGNATIASSTDYSTHVSDLRRGSNEFRWTVNAKGCEEYDDVIIYNNSFDVDAGLDQTVCSDTAQLIAVEVPGGTGQWSVQGTSAATIDDDANDTTIVRNLEQGVNVFRWSVTRNGCTFYDDVTVTNDQPDDAVVLTAPDTICVDTLLLQAVAPEAGVDGLWTFSGPGGTIDDPTNNVTVVRDIKPGATTYIWTVTHNSCSKSASVTIVNSMVTSNAGGDQLALCQDYTSLNAVDPTAPATGWWEALDGGVIASSTDAITDVTSLGYGENKFVWHVEQGKCSATDTVVIRNNMPSKPAVGNVPPTCDGTANLIATPPTYGTGEWSYIGTAPVVIQSPNNTSTLVTNLEYGANLFKWTVTNVTPYTTCTLDTTLTVLNYEFTVDAGNDKILCDSLTHLEGETRPAADSMKWRIITGLATVADTTDPNSQINIPEGSSVILKWMVWENGCYAEDLVTIKNMGVTAIAYDDEVCVDSARLQAVPPTSGNKGYWTTANTNVIYKDSSTQYNAWAINLRQGANQFTWHVYNDYCIDSTIINVNYLVPYSYAGPSPMHYCSDEAIMTANDPTEYDPNATGEWSLVYGNAVFEDSTLYNTKVTGLSQGRNVLAWTVTLRNCSTTTQVEIYNDNPYVAVGPTQNICDSVTILSGNLPDTAAGEIGWWTKITSGDHIIVDSTQYNTQVIGLDPGSHTFRWTIKKGGCEDYRDLIVNNNSITAYAGTDQATCADSAQLFADLPPNATGYWISPTTGPVIVDSTLNNTWVLNLNEGNNTFKWHIERNGCWDEDEVVITNNMVYVNAGDDQTICQNNTTLSASNPPTDGGGVWSVVGGNAVFADDSANTTKVTELAVGANTLQWKVWNQYCSDSDQVTIINNEVFAEAGAGDPALCDNKFELNATQPQAGETGYWQVVAGYGEIDQSTDFNTWVRNLSRGDNVLRWTIEKNGCSNYDDILIRNIMPTQAITVDQKLICSDYTTITGNEPRYGVGHWEIVLAPPAATIDDSTANSTMVRNLGVGPNQFAWVIVDTTTGCATSDTIEVLNNSVTAFAGNDAEICVDTFKLQATDPGINSGIWTKVTAAGTFDDATQYNTIVRDLAVGANILRWTVYNSTCSASDDVVVTNNTPTTADAGPDQVSCDNSAYLTGNTPALDEQGLWFTIGGSSVIDDPTNYTTQVHNLDYGNNLFVWQITRGICVSTDTLLIEGHQIFVDAGQDQEVCKDTALLRGNAPAAGISTAWTLVGGSGTIDNSNSYQTVVRDLGPGVNTFRWTMSDGTCTSYDEVSITNNNPTDPVVCYDTVNICADYTTLCANNPAGGETGTWSVAAGYAVIDDPNNPSSTVYDLSDETRMVWTITKGICSESDTMYIFNGSVDAAVSQDTAEYCGIKGTLAANEDTTATTYWELISGSGSIVNSTAAVTDVIGLSPGANTFRWHVEANGCSSTADMVLLNNVYPASANMAATNPICDSSVVVIGNPPDAGAIGTWTIISGNGWFDDPHNPTTTAHGLPRGQTTIAWVVSKGSCSNQDTIIVQNNSVDANAGQDVIVCDTNEVAQLVANDPQTYNATGHWEYVSGTYVISNTDSYETSVTNVGYGTNVAKWVVTGSGCSDSDYVMISNNHFTVSAGINKDICDTTTILTGTDPGTGGSGLWSKLGGTGWFEDPTNYSTRVNGVYGELNTYQWTVWKNGCVAYDTVVIANKTPYANAGGDREICEDSVQLSAVNPPSGTGRWSLTGGAGTIVNPDDPNTWVTDLAKGTNTLRWTVQNGSCSAYDDVVITNNMVTQTAGVDQYVCEDEAYLAADPPGPTGHGLWTKLSASGVFEDSTLFNTRVYNLGPGVNTFQWTVWENGCSNTTQVHVYNNKLDVYAGPDDITSVPSYTLNAQQPTANQTGTWTIISGSGTFSDNNAYDATVTGLQYGVNTYRWSIYDNVTGCSGYDDVDIIYNGLTVDAGPDQNICWDSTQLNAQEVAGAQAQYWLALQGSPEFEDQNDPQTIIRNVRRGVTILTWNVTKNGFTTQDTVVINNYNFDTDAGDRQDLCYDTTTLDAETILNYGMPIDWTQVDMSWQIVEGGGVLSDNTDPKSKISSLAAGHTLLRWTIRRNDYPGVEACTATDTVSLYYYKLPATEFATDPELGRGCHPLQVQFVNRTDAGGILPGTQFIWNFANMQEVTVPYADTITRTFYNESDVDSVYPVWLTQRVQVAEGVVCSDTVEHDITVYAVPDVDFSPSPLVQYYPQTNVHIENLCSTNFDRYQWDFGDGTGIVQDSYIPYFDHDYYDAGWGRYTITLTVWNNRCSNTDSQTVVILAPPPQSPPYATNSTEGCEPLTVHLYPQVLYTTPGQSEYKWIITRENDTGVVATLYDQEPVYSFTESGTYYVNLWVTAEGTNPPWAWTEIRTDTIVVYPKPKAAFSFEPNRVMVNELVHCYNYSEGGSQYLWNFGVIDSSYLSSEYEPVVSYPTPGRYYITLKVFSDKGCTDEYTAEEPVEVLPEGRLLFPTAFTPGSPIAIDREFKPKYEGEITSYELQIYNRWGQLLFISNDIDKGWDGTIGGSPAPQDVYAYKATVKFRSGLTKTYTGSVTLLR